MKIAVVNIVGLERPIPSRIGTGFPAAGLRAINGTAENLCSETTRNRGIPALQDFVGKTRKG